jgi:hypothetical protein
MHDLSEQATALLQQGDRTLYQFTLDQRAATFDADSPLLIIDLAIFGIA